MIFFMNCVSSYLGIKESNLDIKRKKDNFINFIKFPLVDLCAPEPQRPCGAPNLRSPEEHNYFLVIIPFQSVEVKSTL